jgi:hypothetical protein
MTKITNEINDVIMKKYVNEFINKISTKYNINEDHLMNIWKDEEVEVDKENPLKKEIIYNPLLNKYEYGINDEVKKTKKVYGTITIKKGGCPDFGFTNKEYDWDFIENCNDGGIVYFYSKNSFNLGVDLLDFTEEYKYRNWYNKDFIIEKVDKEEVVEVVEEVCEKCHCFIKYCCCELDRLQIIKDDEESSKNGFVPVDDDGDVRWIKNKEVVKDEVVNTKEVFITNKKPLNKTESIKMIEYYLSKRNQKLTNLNKSTLKQLQDIMLKYNIDDNRHKYSLSIKVDEEIELKKENQKEEVNKIRQEKICNAYLNLNEVQKTKYIEFIVKTRNEEYTKKQIQNKIENDKIINRFIQSGSKIEPINETSFKCDGITIHHMGLQKFYKIQTYEDVLKSYTEDLNYNLQEIQKYIIDGTYE